jgi:O-antigen/teichoic acid export membrane protein
VKLVAHVRSVPLLRNAAALISGTVISQAVLLFLSPLFTRVFTPADLGQFASFTAWVSILTLLGSLRYEHAIIVARGEDAIRRVTLLTLALAIIMVFTLWAGVLVLRSAQHDSVPGDPGAHTLVWIPVAVLAASAMSILNQLNIRVGAFTHIAGAAVVQSLVTITAQIVLGLLQVPQALPIGFVAGYVAGGIVLWRARPSRAYGGQLLADVGVPQFRITAAEYSHFPRYTLGADALVVLNQQFIPVALLALFGPAAAGLVSLALRVLRVPQIVVVNALTSALRKETVDRRDAGYRLDRLFTRTTATLLLAGVVPFVVIAIAGADIFAYAFGVEWREAGELAPTFLLVLGAQRYSFRLQVAATLLLASVILVAGASYRSLAATCAGIAATLVLINGAALFVTFRVVHNDRAQPMPQGVST